MCLAVRPVPVTRTPAKNSMPLPNYQPVERRPITSRDRKAFQIMAKWLVRHGASPNAISLLGMFAAIAGGACLALTAVEAELRRPLWFAAAVLVQLRLLANMLDGMVAISSQRASALGELYNEVPDRASDAAVFIGLGCAVGGDVILGFAATAVAVFTAYVRAMGKVAGANQEFCGPMGKPQRMFVVTVVALYGGLAPDRWQPLWGLNNAALVLIIFGGLITAVRRLLRIAANLKAKAKKP